MPIPELKAERNSYIEIDFRFATHRLVRVASCEGVNLGLASATQVDSRCRLVADCSEPVNAVTENRVTSDQSSTWGDTVYIGIAGVRGLNYLEGAIRVKK